MKYLTVAVILLLCAGGCVSRSSVRSDPDLEPAKEYLDECIAAYTDSVASYAHDHALVDAEPSDIARAALSESEPLFHNYSDAAHRYIVASLGSRLANSRDGRATLKSGTSRFRGRVFDMAIRVVVERRSELRSEARAQWLLAAANHYLSVAAYALKNSDGPGTTGEVVASALATHDDLLQQASNAYELLLHSARDPTLKPLEEWRREHLREARDDAVKAVNVIRAPDAPPTSP